MPSKINQIPPLLPPGVDNNSFSNGNTMTVQGNNIVVGSGSGGVGNNNNNNNNTANIIRNDSRGPVPLMSQPVSMPNMNLPPPAATVAAQKQQSYSNSSSNNINIDISNFTVSIKLLDFPNKKKLKMFFCFFFRILNLHHHYLVKLYYHHQDKILNLVMVYHLQIFLYQIYQNRHQVLQIHQQVWPFLVVIRLYLLP